MSIKKYKNIKVTLDYPGLPYRPGDVVTGRLEGLADTNIQYVQLLFQGEVKYRHLKARAHYYNALILAQTITVHPDANGEWLFAVPVPRMTDPAALSSSSYNRPPSSEMGAARFAADLEHPIPPTMPMIVSKTGTEIPEHSAWVEYSLQPTVAKHPSQEVPVPVAKAVVCFWITKNYPPADEIQQLASHGERAQGGQFKAWGKKLAKAIGVQDKKLLSSCSVAFQATFSTPSSVHLGDSITTQVTLQLQESNIPGLTPAQVPVKLTGLKLALQRHWFSYGEKLFSEVNVIASPECMDAASPVTLEPRADGYTTVSIPCNSYPLPQIVSPDFETTHVCVRHKVTVMAMFDIAGEPRSSRTTLPIRVLPWPRAPTPDGRTEGFVEGPQDLTEDWGELIGSPLGLRAATYPQPWQQGYGGAVGTMNAAAAGVNVAFQASATCCNIL